MPIFKATVTVLVPCYMEAEAEVDAPTREDAEKKVRMMYDNDELEFDQGEKDYDEAKITAIKFSGDNS